MPTAGGLETANPALRFNAEDKYWYCITARMDPGSGSKKRPASWYFFTEIFRSKDLVTWEPGYGMGSTDVPDIAIATNDTDFFPMLRPNATADKVTAAAVLKVGALEMPLNTQIREFLKSMEPFS